MLDFIRLFLSLARTLCPTPALLLLVSGTPSDQRQSVGGSAVFLHCEVWRWSGPRDPEQACPFAHSGSHLLPSLYRGFFCSPLLLSPLWFFLRLVHVPSLLPLLFIVLTRSLYRCFFLTITSSFICLFLAIDQSSEAANLNMNFTFLPFICFPLNLCLIWFILDSINQFISITPRRILFIFQSHLCPV